MRKHIVKQQSEDYVACAKILLIDWQDILQDTKPTFDHGFRGLFPRIINIEHREGTREWLLELAKKTAEARIVVKVAGLFLISDAQRSGWVTQVLGLTNMSLSR